MASIHYTNQFNKLKETQLSNFDTHNNIIVLGWEEEGIDAGQKNPVWTRILKRRKNICYEYRGIDAEKKKQGGLSKE